MKDPVHLGWLAKAVAVFKVAAHSTIAVGKNETGIWDMENSQLGSLRYRNLMWEVLGSLHETGGVLNISSRLGPPE